MRSVTFITCCCERGWAEVLKQSFCKKIQRNRHYFSKKVLAINNVKNRVNVNKYAEKAEDDGVINDFSC